MTRISNKDALVAAARILLDSIPEEKITEANVAQISSKIEQNATAMGWSDLQNARQVMATEIISRIFKGYENLIGAIDV